VQRMKSSIAAWSPKFEGGGRTVRREVLRDVANPGSVLLGGKTRFSYYEV